MITFLQTMMYAKKPCDDAWLSVEFTHGWYQEFKVHAWYDECVFLELKRASATTGHVTHYHQQEPRAYTLKNVVSVAWVKPLFGDEK